MPCPVPRGFAALPRIPAVRAGRPFARAGGSRPDPVRRRISALAFFRACGRMKRQRGSVSTAAVRSSKRRTRQPSRWWRTLPNCRPWSAFAQGVPAYPDRSATVLLAGLAFDAGTRFRSSGPGICGESTFTCTLPEDFAERWRENASGFPLGVDMLLCGADGVAGLPRTTRLERLPQESASCM